MKKPNVVSMQALQDIWYLDLCVSQYFTNNKNLFIKKFYFKCFDFIMSKSQILWAQKIGTITILLLDIYFL